ncbi:hypothetical protein K525DRAFT_278038 [Schizophyllum commune Loenen D]|nr:hypothetical protein K525DRAFT_278038 [Schizophyllum commune Loenen D]
MGSLFVEASAKTAEGVREVFGKLIEKVLEGEALGGGSETRTDHGRGGVPGGVQVVRLDGEGSGREEGGCGC